MPLISPGEAMLSQGATHKRDGKTKVRAPEGREN